MDSTQVVIISVAVLTVGVGLGFLLFRLWEAARIGSIQERTQSILKQAELESDKLVKEAEAQAKEQALSTRSEVERESRKKREELQRLEKRLRQKEANIERKNDLLEKRESEFKRRDRVLQNKESKLTKDEEEMEAAIAKVQSRLEEVSGFSREDARKQLLSSLEESAKLEAARSIRQIEEEMVKEADEKARKLITTAMQRLAGEYVAEKTVSVVELPSDEMKGRIIGREGRNIRALEAATGVDVIIDDTPEAVILSSFDPIRRETAKLALNKLISDGRIHPARIEEVVQKSSSEMNQIVQRAGEQATFELGLHGVHPEVVKAIGRLKFRNSGGQNQWQHAIETGFIAGLLAAELGIKIKMARRAGLFHDIGKAIDHEMEGSHANVGAEFIRRYGERNEVVNAVRCHHNEVEPSNALDVIVQVANELSKRRPGARKDVLQTYIRRLEELEQLAAGFDGVMKAYVIQAGREVRVMVNYNEISDDQLYLLNKEITKRVEDELSYPGQIRITVIRESRAIEYAK